MTTEAPVARALNTAELDLALLRRTCETCECFAPSDHPPPEGSPKMGQCRRDPPRVSTFPLPPQLAGGPIRDLSFSNWPIVFADNWCIAGYLPLKGSQQ